MKITVLILLFSWFHAYAQHVEPTNLKSDSVVTFISCDAEFPGGVDSLLQFIQRIGEHIPGDWSDFSYDKGGYLHFIVETDGSISDLEMIRSISHEADELVLSYFQTMPNWTPACDENGPVRSRNRLPITFIRPE